MLDAIKLMVESTWKLLNIKLPLTTANYTFTDINGAVRTIPKIEITIWQYFFFLIICVTLIKIIWAQKTTGSR